MKRLIMMTGLLLALSVSAVAQVEIFNYNVSGGPVGGFQEQEGIMARKSPNRFFDFLTYESNGESFKYSFIALKGSGLKYSRVQRELKEQFGSPDTNDDYIPEGAEDDEQYLASLVSLERAEILRMWNIEEHNLEVSFIWTSDLFAVNFTTTPD